MARDEKEREKKKREEAERKRREETSGQDTTRKGKGLMIRSDPGEPSGRIRATRPMTLHANAWSGTGPQNVERPAPRPRVFASTERLPRSSRVLSGNSSRVPGRERLPPAARTRPPPVIPVAKPTPTKTSILREAAAKAAKDGKLKRSSGKSVSHESPTRATGFSLSRASPSRSVGLSLDKAPPPAFDIYEDDSRTRRLPGFSIEGPGRRAPQSSDSNRSPIYRGNETSLDDIRKAVSKSADPVFSLRPQYGSRRMNHNTTEDSEQFSSEWSDQTSIRCAPRRSNTPQSPATKQNEDFSPLSDNPLHANRTLPQVRLKHMVEERVASRDYDKENTFPFAGPLNSPVEINEADQPFEEFESDDEMDPAQAYGLPQNSPRHATLPRYIPAGEEGSPSHDRPDNRRIYDTSPRPRKSYMRSSTRTTDQQSVEVNPSRVKPILTASHGKLRGSRTDDDSRDPIKSVRWDPAVTSAGYHMSPAEGNKKNYIDLPTDYLEDRPAGMVLDEYLNTVTQSLAKLKKTNPKVIGHLLAALRDLKSDDESSSEPDTTKHKDSVPESEYSKASASLKAEEIPVPELPKQSDETPSMRGRLASAIKMMNQARTLDEMLVARQEKSFQNLAEEKTWGEIDPSIIMQSPPRIKPVAYPQNEKSTTSTSASVGISTQEAQHDGGSAIRQAASPTKLNPLAPAFGESKGLKEKSGHNNYIHPLQITVPNPFVVRLPGRLPLVEMNLKENRGPAAPQTWTRPPNEPIWINTSKFPKPDLDYSLEDTCAADVPLPSTEDYQGITPILPQPHIFKVPPGYIPLIPFPGLFPQVPALPPVFPNVNVKPLQVIPNLKNKEIKVTQPVVPLEETEWELGRTALRLEKKWGSNLLAAFSQKYPLTGQRAPASELPTIVPPTFQTSVPTAPKPACALQRTRGFKLHPRAQNRVYKKGFTEVDRVVKCQRAAQIQEELERRILEFKERKAAEMKELQKREIERVAKILPLIRARSMKSKVILEEGIRNGEEIRNGGSGGVAGGDDDWEKVVVVPGKKVALGDKNEGEKSLKGGVDMGSLVVVEDSESSDLMRFTPECEGKELSIEEPLGRVIVHEKEVEASGKLGVLLDGRINSRSSNATVEKVQASTKPDTPSRAPSATKPENLPTVASSPSSVPAAGPPSEAISSSSLPADPLKLLTVDEWKEQSSSSSYGPISMAPSTGGHDTSFVAPKFLWDFLNLEFALEDLRSLTKICHTGTSRSTSNTSGTSSAALSDTRLQAHRQLSTSAEGHRSRAGDRQRFSSYSWPSTGTSTAVSEDLSGIVGSVGSVEEEHGPVELRFEWMGSSERNVSGNTVEISPEELEEVIPSPSSENLSKDKGREVGIGRLLTLTEGSAAADAWEAKQEREREHEWDVELVEEKVEEKVEEGDGDGEGEMRDLSFSSSVGESESLSLSMGLRDDRGENGDEAERKYESGYWFY